MDDNFMLIPVRVADEHAVKEITKYNEATGKYGLTLSPAAAKELVQTRNQALNSFGRVEFGGGIISKLIEAFCDSPYIMQSNYAETLNELVETFYYFKNESMDAISDDELIKLMKDYFDNRCRGSVRLLQERELEKLARNVRFGVTNFANLENEYVYEQDADAIPEEDDIPEEDSE